MPLVSIVVPCWNYEKFVGTTIESIRCQDYPSVECIVVDNASTDTSLAVIRRHVGDDPRFQIVALDENLGQLGALTEVFGRLRGEFVAVVDADDVLLPNFVSTHVQVHVSGPVPVGLSSNAFVEVNAEGRAQLVHGMVSAGGEKHQKKGLRPGWSVIRLATVPDDQYERLGLATTTFDRRMSGRPWSPGTANLMRRFALDAILPKRHDKVDLRFGDQHYMNFIHAIWGSAFIDVPLSLYRLHGGNTSAQRSRIPGSRHWDSREKSRGRAMRLETVGELLAEPDLVLRHSDHFWSVVDQVLGEKTGLWRSCYVGAEVEQVFARNYRTLVARFGRSRTIRPLAERFRPLALLRVLRLAGKPALRVAAASHRNPRQS